MFSARTVIDIATSSFAGRIALICGEDDGSRILFHLVRASAPETAILTTEGFNLIEHDANMGVKKHLKVVSMAAQECVPPTASARRLDAGSAAAVSQRESGSTRLAHALRDFDACLYHPAVLADGGDEAPDVAGFVHGKLAFAPLIHWRADEIANLAATLPVVNLPARRSPEPRSTRMSSGPRLAFSHGRAVTAP